MAPAAVSAEAHPVAAGVVDEGAPLHCNAGSGEKLSNTIIKYSGFTGELFTFLLDHKAFAWTVLTTLATAPTLLFGSLHMIAFLDLHKITLAQVAAAQSVYFVWNIVSGVFAGYVADQYTARWGSRLGFLCGVQIFWVFTVFFPFLPVSTSQTKGWKGTLFYLACISVQEGCLNLAGVARGTLMAELTRSESECVRFKRWNSIAGNVEVLVNLSGYALWSASSQRPFLSYLGVIVALAICFNFWSAAALRQHVPVVQQVVDREPTAVLPLAATVRSFSKNTWVYIAIAALEAMQSVAWGQFQIPMMEALLGDSSKAWRVTFFGFIGAAGGLVALLSSWPAESSSVYNVLLWTFRLKVVLALLLIALTAVTGISQIIVCCFMLLNEISMHMVAYFDVIVMVGLLGEFSASRRDLGLEHPLAAHPLACGPALFMGTSAFFIKPFSSVGPVVGTALLAADSVSGPEGKIRALTLLAIAPLLVGAAQWFLWGGLFAPNRVRQTQGSQGSGWSI